MEDDPKFGLRSAECLSKHLHEGLAISPVSAVELAPAFDGDENLQHQFFAGLGAHVTRWDDDDTHEAFVAWHRYIAAKRTGTIVKRPDADILIGAMAIGRTGLITRNARDFLPWFPEMKIVTP